MEQPSYVVVFPATFSQNKMPQLVSNIKKMLGARGQEFRSVRRDGDVILVEANDPVFASSAVNLLFGIRKVAIARRVENDYEKIIDEIASVGGNLLLKGERFLVRVEGASRGFLPEDVELAATSKIIESRADLGAKPGTEQRHDKVLYSYLTKKNAYVCIFTDAGRGGIPLVPNRNDAICCIYDELSAVACYETIRQGFNPRVLVCYRKKPELLGLARALNQILPRLLEESVTVEVFRAKPPAAMAYQQMAGLALGILLSRAEAFGIRRIAVPASSLIFPAYYVDHLVQKVFEAKKIPVLPLVGLDSGIFEDMAELGMQRYAKRIARLPARGAKGADFAKKELGAALRSRQEITLRVGPNNVHDFLDAL